MFFLMHVHFDIRLLKCQNIAFSLPYSGVSKMTKYWIYEENVFSFTIMILFLLSFLGILSVWSDKGRRELYQRKKLVYNEFPSSCKISDQTDKIPRNKSKNKGIMVNVNTFSM